MTALDDGAFGPSVNIDAQFDGARRSLPLILHAVGGAHAADGEMGVSDIGAVVRTHGPALIDAVERHGAVLLRGFEVAGIDAFESVCAAVASPLMAYRDRATPRSVVGGHVLTATDYPPNVAICLHNENVFAAEFPSRIFFHCMHAALDGGETPLADVRRVYERIPAAIRDEFERRGVLYARTFGGRFGLDWREVFQLDDRRELEEYCRAAEIDWEWDGDSLRTRQRRPAVAVHPRTGERVWLNHLAALHVSSLEPAKRRMLTKLLGDRDLPNNVYYGDGVTIADDIVATVRDAYDDLAVAVEWQTNDVLMVDNLLVAHGRRPFSGRRELVVAMAAPVAWTAVAGENPTAPGNDRTRTDGGL
jgi:alpha-ketoglutarate-dependent taurine dioxygenase